MSARVAVVGNYVRFTNTSFWRDPASAVFAFLFPLLFIVINSLVFGDFETVIYGETVPLKEYYIPAFSVFALVNVAFVNLSISVAYSRDQGNLKRIFGTPTSVWTYLSAMVIHRVAISFGVVAAIVVYGLAVNGATPRLASMPAFIVTLVLSAAAFSALGLAIVPAFPNSDSAPAIANGIVFPLLFVSGIFIPPDALPGWLDEAASIFPIRASADAMVGAFFAESGSGLQPLNLAVLTVWCLGGMALAARFFSWRPRR